MLIPSLSLLVDTRAAFDLITQPVNSGLVKSILDCVAYLESPDRTSEEIDTSNQWFRKTLVQSDLAEIKRTGLDNYEKEKSPALVASLMKSFLRSIPGSFIHKSSQNLLIFLLSNGIAHDLTLSYPKPSNAASTNQHSH
jgi:hypothetical protein